VVCEIPNRAPGAPRLSGNVAGIRIQPGSRLHAIYGRDQTEEGFFCNYELNPEYEPQLETRGLRFVARGTQGEVRALERPGHRFLLGTLFQPQLSSSETAPHPIIVALVRAAAELQASRASGAAAT
jgi:CTP synthase (UTP-ammonia lyase)